MTLYNEATALLPQLKDWRRYFHQHAEGGYKLPQTLAFIRQVLDAYHIAFYEPGESIIVCDIGQGEDGMILRADTDALPMKEENTLSFQSTTAFAHTCGHDFHTAMLLGAAVLLKKREQSLPFRTRLVFQPDEEGATGAQYLIDHGVLDGHFQGAFALHMSPVQQSGVLFYREGALYASSDEIKITIQGKSAHGASPQNGHDPIFAAVQIYQALQGLISRECAPEEMAVLSICAFHSGKVFNLVPQEAEMLGTLRTYNKTLRDYLKQRIHDVVTSVAQACQCSANVSYPVSLPPVICDAMLHQRLLSSLEKALPSHLLAPQPHPFTWSEDFGLFSEHLPITMMTLGAQVADHTANIHNPDVAFDEASLATGTAALAIAALS